MEIISSNDGILCNAEVMNIIKERKGNYTRGNPAFQNREVLEFQLESYFSNQNISDVPSHVAEFISICRSSDIDLTRAEFLQIFNLLPTNVVEFHLIIEECNERLTEEQVDFLAEKVESILKKSAVLS